GSLLAHLPVLIPSLGHLLDVGADHDLVDLVGGLSHPGLAGHHPHLGLDLTYDVAPAGVAGLHGILQLGGELGFDLGRAGLLVGRHGRYSATWSRNFRGTSEMIAAAPS